MRHLAFVLSAALAAAQTPPQAPAAPAAPAGQATGAAQAPDGIRGVMLPSLDKQKESVRRQVRAAQPADPGWFTVPWPSIQWTAPVQPSDAGSPVANAGWRPDCEPVPQTERESYFQRAAAKQGIDVGLIREVARRESAFYPCAVSSKGAVGLMQLMPGTATSLGVTDPFDPESNVFAGAQLLSTLLGRYRGDTRLALAAYNAGSGRVEDYGGVPPFRETQNYVGKILEAVGSGDPGAAQ
ncbi:MAG: lytic transglycosylase domain-containing protein [Acidobacteriota bacterium]